MTVRPALLLSAALITHTLCPALIAQPTPDGGEFQVNTFTPYFQYDAAVAVTGSGAFVVVWESDFQDGSDYSVQGRRYNADGTPAGGEFQVNSYTPGYQDDPEVAIDGDGDFIVVWVSEGQDGDNDSVQGQRYNADGTTDGSEFQVNTYTTDGQDSPAVAMTSSGAFVVVWESDAQDGSYDSVHGQRYNADGTTAGSEFQVNTYTTNDQDDPEIAIDAAGNFVVVWESDGQDGSGDSVQARLYNADGTPASGEFQINTHTTGNQREPRVAMDSLGNFAVVWESTGQDGAGQSVHGRRFNASGTPLSGEFQVNTHTTDDQDSPAVAMSPSGAFVVTWESDTQDGSYDSVHGQRYNADGTTVDGEFQVNTYTTDDQDDPAVGVDANGDFVVVWESFGQDGSFDCVHGQRYAGPLPAVLTSFSVE